jgi:dTDP-4-dehydrorhamnose 3,5-epimerase
VLSEANRHTLYLPKGFAHGFVVRSDVADFLYKCNDYYDAADDCGVLWNDPAIRIQWDAPSPIISAKDQGNPPLSQVPRERLPVYEP